MHTPETPAESIAATVRTKAKANHMDYPIAIDNMSQTWQAWGNQYWPAVYLIDKKGRVRFRWDGELNYAGSDGDKIIRGKIEKLLNER